LFCLFEALAGARFAAMRGRDGSDAVVVREIKEGDGEAVYNASP